MVGRVFGKVAKTEECCRIGVVRGHFEAVADRFQIEVGHQVLHAVLFLVAALHLVPQNPASVLAQRRSAIQGVSTAPYTMSVPSIP